MRLRIHPALALFAILSIAACDEDSSPTTPANGDGEQTALAGSVQNAIGFSTPINLHVVSDTVDTTILITDNYILPDIPAGSYTLSAEVYGPNFPVKVILPSSKTVTVTSGLVQVDPFCVIYEADKLYHEENSLGMVIGRISCTNMMRDAFHLTITSPGGDIVARVDEENGSFVEKELPYGTYRIIPELYHFSFDPPYRTITVDDLWTVADFSAEYTGPKLHTISCNIVSDVQRYYGGISVVRFEDWLWPSNGITDENGYAVSLLLEPGEYQIRIWCSANGTSNDDFGGDKVLPVIVSDSDIDLGDFMFHYTGPMYYRITVKVTDAAGNGIEGVTVTLANSPAGTRTATTNPNGFYSFSGSRYSTTRDLDMTLTAAKSGWVFEPPSMNFTQAYDRTLTLVELTADFTAAPVEQVTAP